MASMHHALAASGSPLPAVFRRLALLLRPRAGTRSCIDCDSEDSRELTRWGRAQGGIGQTACLAVLKVP